MVGTAGGHPEACAHGDENRQEDAEDGNADGAERVEQVQQGEHDAQGKDEVQAHDAAVGDESGKERGGAGVLDDAAHGHDGAAHDHDTPGHGLLEFLPREKLDARKEHDRQADEGHHGRVEQGNPVADNPEHQQADNDDDGLDLVRLDLGSCSSLVANALQARIGNGLGLEDLGDEEPGDRSHEDDDRQGDDNPVQEGHARASGHLLHDAHRDHVEGATGGSSHAAGDGRNGNADHEAASEVGLEGLCIRRFEDREREAHEQDGAGHVGHDHGHDGRRDHEAEHELARVVARPLEKRVHETNAPVGFHHDDRQREHRDDEEQRGTREATDGASEIGHDSEHGAQHDDEQCGDAQRQRRGDPQGDEGQQQAQGPSALGG